MVEAAKCKAELTLNLGFDIVDGIRRLHLEGDGLARYCAQDVSTSI